jgi:hypothetical protein
MMSANSESIVNNTELHEREKESWRAQIAALEAQLAKSSTEHECALQQLREASKTELSQAKKDMEHQLEQRVAKTSYSPRRSPTPKSPGRAGKPGSNSKSRRDTKSEVNCDSTISSGSSSSDPMRITTSGENDIISGQVSIGSDSKMPLSAHDENIKSEAVSMIQDAITTQEEWKEKISEKIEHNAQIGLARLEGSNQRGTPSYLSSPYCPLLPRSLILLLLLSQALSCP